MDSVAVAAESNRPEDGDDDGEWSQDPITEKWHKVIPPKPVVVDETPECFKFIINNRRPRTGAKKKRIVKKVVKRVNKNKNNKKIKKSKK